MCLPLGFYGAAPAGLSWHRARPQGCSLPTVQSEDPGLLHSLRAHPGCTPRALPPRHCFLTTDCWSALAGGRVSRGLLPFPWLSRTLCSSTREFRASHPLGPAGLTSWELAHSAARWPAGVLVRAYCVPGFVLRGFGDTQRSTRWPPFPWGQWSPGISRSHSPWERQRRSQVVS